MKRSLKYLIVFLLFGAVAAAAYKPVTEYWKQRNKVTWETSEIIEGDLIRYVNSTGTVEPVLSVSVGSFVSGPIVELNVDFNDVVEKGEILAKIDPRLFKANVERDEAILSTRVADVERIEAQLQQALNNYKRGERIRQKNKDYLSDREMDALVYEVKALQAQRKLAKAGVLQATASLDNSQANLKYTNIEAPVDGVVIDRKIDPGQTLAAQFQTPELFVVAPDLRQRVHVYASVDEADIGLIQKAQLEDRQVKFNVQAHLDELFDGEIEQIRVSSTTNQNVVTYPVVVGAANPDMKLLPGMTATVSFEVDSKANVPKIPNEALRFYPLDISRVRKEDRKLLDGSLWSSGNDDDEDEIELSAAEKAEARQARNKRHVWVVEGEFLRAVEVLTGLTDNRFTEMVSGELKVGDKLVTGQKS